MAACLESLSLANVSNNIKSVASLVLEASEGDKDGQFSKKIKFSRLLHSHAVDAAHWAYLFDVMDRPCVQLVCPRTAPPALS